jgi:hypothetical protein
MQFMSLCGAKVYNVEMIKSESMAILFHSLSTFMPLIIEDLKRARAAKLGKLGNKVVNPRTKKAGTHVYTHIILFVSHTPQLRFMHL